MSRLRRCVVIFAVVAMMPVAPKGASGEPNEEDPFAEQRSPISNTAPPAPTTPRTHPPRLRVQFATGLTQVWGSRMQWPDGTTADYSCEAAAICNLRFALAAGVDWSPVRFFGIGIHARWLVGRAAWEEYMGRHLDIVEVVLVPKFELPWKWRWPYGGARPYLAVPFGPTWAHETRTWSRAVSEDWNSRTGLSAGVALGMEFYWKHHWGWFVELNYQKHALSADVTETPIADPAARVTERISVKEADLILSVGHLFGIDR